VTIVNSMRTFVRHRHLIWQMTKREVVGRYRGSVLGILWSFLNPVFMLTIYTFVFSVVFKAKWGTGSDSKTEFAIILFAGLIVFNLFSETVARSPSLILSNVNYVKKVVFPLEILPVVSILSSCFHTLVSIGVLILFRLVVGNGFSITTLLFPIINYCAAAALFAWHFLVSGCPWSLSAGCVSGHRNGHDSTAFCQPDIFPNNCPPRKIPNFCIPKSAFLHN